MLRRHKYTSLSELQVAEEAEISKFPMTVGKKEVILFFAVWLLLSSPYVSNLMQTLRVLCGISLLHVEPEKIPAV